MWRQISPKKNQLELFKGMLASYGVFGFLDDLIILPLIVISLSAIWVIGWDWRLLLLLPLTFFCAFSIHNIRLYHRTSKIIDELAELYRRNRDWKYKPITVGEYLETLYQSSSAKQGEGDKRNEEEFARSMLSENEYHFGDYLRFIIVETKEDSILSVLATFATPKRAWIFLNGNPAEMDELAHFNVLHEVGHTSLYNTVNLLNRGDLTTYFLSLPVVALMLRWNYTTLILILFFLLTYLSLREISYKWMRRRSRYYEEVHADDFAVKRLPDSWFKNFSSDEEVDVFATMVAGNLALKNKRRNSHSIYDAPLTEEQTNWRKIILTNKIYRRLKGEEYKPVGYVPGCGYFLIRVLIIIQNAVLVFLLILLGLQHGELTWLRFFSLMAVTLLITSIGLAFDRLSLAWPDYWDTLIISKELSSSRQKNVDDAIKGALWGKKVGDWRWERELKRQERLEKEKDKNIDLNFVPPGVTGTLFLPAEVDLYVDINTTEAFIYHGKVIDYDISHLEYYSQNHSIVVVMNDGTRLSLGVNLLWLVRPHFLKAKEVTIALTANKKVVNEVTVPLKKIT